MNKTARFTFGILGVFFCIIVGLVLIGVSISYWTIDEFVKCWAIILLAIPLDIAVLSVCAGLVSENNE